MGAKITTTHIPSKEFRRKYMKSLVEDISLNLGITTSEAKVLASQFVTFIGQKVWRGQGIDFGCVAIKPRRKKATVVKSSLARTGKQSYYLGDQVKWSVAVSRGWQRTTKPEWSKYS